MAFGSSRRGGGSGSSDVGVVRLVADTGQANASISEFERNTLEAYRSVSREALKLEVAQERVERSVKRNGVESSRTKAAVLALKDAEEAAARATDRLGREHAQASRQTDVHRRSMLGLAGSVTGLAAAFGGVYGLASQIRKSLDVASSLNEQVSKTRDVFGQASPQVERFARSALGLSNDQALELTSTLGALLRPIGLVGERSAKLSEDLVKRGTDLASFYNRDVTEAINAVRSGIVGESEPLRAFGVRLSEARVQALALAQSGKTSAAALTDQEKVLARVSIILKDSSIAAGNYAKTIGGVANQEREAQGAIRDTQAAIGEKLQPAYLGLLKTVNEYLGDAKNQEKIASQVNDVLDDGVEIVRGFAGAMRTVKSVVDPLVSAVGGLDDAVRLLLIGMAVSKLVGFAGALRGIATAAGLARTQIGLLNRTPVAPGGGGGGVGLVGGAIGLGAVAVAGFGLSNAASEDASNRAKFEALSPDAKAQALRQITKEAAQQFFGVSSSEYDRIVRGTAALPVDFSAGGLTPQQTGKTAGGFAQMGGATPQSTTPVGAATSSSSFALQLARATTDQQRLQLLLRQRGFLERGVARFQGKGMGQAELRFRNELDTVQGQITGIFASRNEARDARQQSIDEAAATRRAKDEADKAERIATRDANRQERTATQDARIGFLKTKAGLTPTLKDDISAERTELALIRSRVGQAKQKTAAWYALKAEEATAANALNQLLDTREKNQSKADDKARAARVMKAARKLGINQAGPGAGGPVGLEGLDMLVRQANFAFLGQLQGATNQYGSNYSGPGKQVVIHNNWPTAAVDVNQWGIYQRHSLERAGMVG